MYEFITVGGGEYFVDIFNGVASIIKSGDYMNIVKIAGALAFFIAIINAVLMNSLYDASKWFLTTFIVMQILLFPKATVHITDKTNPVLQGAKVDNVPFVVAYVASTSSNAGYHLSKLFETVFSLPDDLKYSENGMLFGVNLFQAISQARISDSKLSSSIDNFSRNCIFFDLQLGIYSFDDLKNSDDIWHFIQSKQVENRFFTYTAKNGTTSYPSCKDGFAKLDIDFKNELKSPTNIGFFAKKPNLTKALFQKATTDVNQYFLNVSKSSEEVLQQAMMINAIDDATQNYEAQNQIDLYQNTRATLQAKSTYRAMGTQAGIWIPILKIVIESIFIGAFPLVILIALIPNFTATVLRGYLGTFFWLAAWGPIYAILHRISMGHAQSYTLGLGGFTLYNQAGLESSMGDIAAMAGYMSMFVPMLAFGIAKGGAAAMSSMTTSFMSGVQGSVSTAAHEASTGNLSFGNVGVNSRAISSGVSIMNDSGQVGRYHNDGGFTIDNSQTESRLGAFDLRGSQRVESALSNAVSQEQSLGHTKSTQAQSLEADGFEKAISNHRAIESSRGFEQNATSQEKVSFSKVSSAADEFAKEHNITKSKSAEIFGQLGGGLGLGSKGAGLSADAGGRLSASADDRNLYNEAQKFSQDKRLSHDFEVMRSSLQSNRFNATDSQGESINENFTKSSNLSKEAGIHFENSQRFSEQQQHIQSNSFDYDQSYNNEFVNHLRNKYGSEKAVFEITNPNSMDNTLRDKEISEFNAHKEQEIIKSISKPNFEGQYNESSQSLSNQKQPHRQPHSFSQNAPEIDNSALQHSVDKKFDDTRQMIRDTKLNNSVIGEVRKKQDDGLI